MVFIYTSSGLLQSANAVPTSAAENAIRIAATIAIAFKDVHFIEDILPFLVYFLAILASCLLR
jgi:hypothetical protein